MPAATIPENAAGRAAPGSGTQAAPTPAKPAADRTADELQTMFLIKLSPLTMRILAVCCCVELMRMVLNSEKILFSLNCFPLSSIEVKKGVSYSKLKYF